jgi:hypothetical protein
VQVGVRVGGQGRSIELLQVDGPVTAGIDILEDGSATLQGSHFDVAGPAIVLAARSQLDATGNVFVAQAPSNMAMHLENGARVVLNRNVFAGFGSTPIEGLAEAERELVRTANVIVSSDPSTR